MSEKVSAGWLTGYDGNKFAPKTFFQEVLNANGARIFANLDTNDDLGSVTKPVYIDNGQFKACDDFNYNLEVVESGGVVYIQLHQDDAVKKQISLTSNNSISITHASDNTISITANYPVFDGKINGLVPAPSDSETVLFLRANGTWDSPSDTKVIQTDNSKTNAYYPILTKYTNSTSGNASTTGYNSNCKINHSSGTIMANYFSATTHVTTPAIFTSALSPSGSNISISTDLIPSSDYNLGAATSYWHNIYSHYLTLRSAVDEETFYTHTSLQDTYAYFYGSTGNTTVRIFHGNNYGTIEVNGYGDYVDNSIDLSARKGTVTAASFNATSDARLKENFISFKPEKSILDLPVYRFDFINGAKNQIGCKAQDLQLICPELVEENEKGYLTVKESKIVYLLLEKMKEMQKEINELKGV